MKVDIKIEGLKEIEKNIDIYAKYMDIGVQAAMEEVIDLIATKARDMAPVDTGKLRNSIQWTVRKMTKDLVTGSVMANIEYAKYIELGSSNRPPDPFLEPALEEGIKRLKKELEAAHKRAASRLKKTRRF